MSRREYKIDPIYVNRVYISGVIIDPHYEEKHGESINDELILTLVRKLDGVIQLPDDEEDGFRYFATLIEIDKKQYRLIWLLEDEQIYIGIINAFRDSKGESK